MHVVTTGTTIAATEFYGPLNQLLTRIASEPKFHGSCWRRLVQDPILVPSDPSLRLGQGEAEAWQVARFMLLVAVPPLQGGWGPTRSGWKNEGDLHRVAPTLVSFTNMAKNVQNSPCCLERPPLEWDGAPLNRICSPGHKHLHLAPLRDSITRVKMSASPLRL